MYARVTQACRSPFGKDKTRQRRKVGYFSASSSSSSASSKMTFLISWVITSRSCASRPGQNQPFFSSQVDPSGFWKRNKTKLVLARAQLKKVISFQPIVLDEQEEWRGRTFAGDFINVCLYLHPSLLKRKITFDPVTTTILTTFSGSQNGCSVTLIFLIKKECLMCYYQCQANAC